MAGTLRFVERGACSAAPLLRVVLIAITLGHAPSVLAQEGRQINIDIVRQRELMPAFPQTGPSNPIITQDMTTRMPINLASVKQDCTNAVAAVIANRKSEPLRERWYSACTATELPPGFEGMNQAAVGIGLTGSSSVFCSGALVNAKTLMTAKHCFFEKNGDAKDSWKALVAGRVEVRSDLGRHRLTCGEGAPEVSHCSARKARFGLSTDILYLAVQGIDPSRFSGVGLGKASVGDELVLFSYFESTGARRYSKAGCQVQRVSSPCIVHNCQADHASSGGALFFRNSTGQLKIAGIHLSGATASSDCGFNTTVTSNIGLLTSH